MAIELTKELLTTKPEELAKHIVSNAKDTSSQIRKFYNDFLILKAKADISATEEEFKTKILPLIYFSKAKMAYSCGRGKITKDLFDKISNMIDKIETKEDFSVFLLFYQSLIGYVTYYSNNQERKENNNNNVYMSQKNPIKVVIKK